MLTDLDPIHSVLKLLPLAEWLSLLLMTISLSNLLSHVLGICLDFLVVKDSDALVIDNLLVKSL